jgi:hypothetical protein
VKLSHLIPLKITNEKKKWKNICFWNFIIFTQKCVFLGSEGVWNFKILAAKWPITSQKWPDMSTAQTIYQKHLVTLEQKLTKKIFNLDPFFLRKIFFFWKNNKNFSLFHLKKSKRELGFVFWKNIFSIFFKFSQKTIVICVFPTLHFYLFKAVKQFFRKKKMDKKNM